MKVKEAINIIDTMYQDRVTFDKQNPNHINLAYKPEFTKLEEASVILLRQCVILENKNKDILRKLRNRVKEVKKLSKYSLYKEEFKRLNKHLTEKDKIIDLMAKWIFDKDYTENSLLIARDDYYSNCIKQVKKYFEKKAMESDKNEI